MNEFKKNALIGFLALGQALRVVSQMHLSQDTNASLTDEPIFNLFLQHNEIQLIHIFGEQR